MCRDLLKQISHWINGKGSNGKIIKGEHLRVCELCYEDSLK